MERRRMMMGSRGIIEDGLLLWFDGLNKGSNPSTQWNPCYSKINGFYLGTRGNPTVVNNGYQCTRGKYLQSNYNPFTYVGDGYTLIFCVSNIDPTKYENSDRALLSINKPPTLSSQRGEFFVRNKEFLATWINGSSTLQSSVAVRKNESGCFVTGVSLTTTLYAKNTGDGYAHDQYNVSRFFSKDASHVVAISTYIVEDNKTNSAVDGTYHAFVMYDRVLSQSEIVQVTRFLNKRYGIN